MSKNKIIGNLLFCNKMHSYKVLCHYASFLLVADYANIILITSGHQNSGFGRGKKKLPNMWIWRTYGMLFSAINLPYCTIVDLRQKCQANILEL